MAQVVAGSNPVSHPNLLLAHILLICYHHFMITSFGDKKTEDVYHGINSKESRRIPSQIWKIACRKLDRLNAALILDDLCVPPGNRLEALKGNLKGFHSVRINDQYRVVFKWRNANAEIVRIQDYHD